MAESDWVPNARALSGELALLRISESLEAAANMALNDFGSIRVLRRTRN